MKIEDEGKKQTKKKKVKTDIPIYNGVYIQKRMFGKFGKMEDS